MFVLCAEKNQLTVREREPITSGSVNAYPVRIEFSRDWDGLERTVIFQAGCEEKAVALSGEACIIPQEVLSAPGRYLMAGVCGRQGGNVVLPTIWVSLGLILEGAAVSTPSDPHPGGIVDHRELSHRDAEGQHPIASITNLERELSKRMNEDDAMSVVDIIKIMEE